MTGMGGALTNPRPGLRRWVSSTMEIDYNRNSLVELHHDGTVTLATNVSWYPASSSERQSFAEEAGVVDALPVRQHVVAAACDDFLITIQELQRRLSLDSTQQITATIYASNGPWALEARTAVFGDGRESTPPYTRRPHHIQPVHTLLPPIADDEEVARVSEELSNDLMSQFGL